jgi:hypothetical protein
MPRLRTCRLLWVLRFEQGRASVRVALPTLRGVNV